MRRVACVWLPAWPIERMRRALGDAWPDEALPLVLVEAGARGLSVAAAGRAAILAGASPGMTLADARAAVPGLLALPAEPAADARALAALARACDRYTPVAATDGEDGLVLDVTGCAGPWGGEDRLMADLRRRLGRDGLTTRGALADTWGAAWALARFADGGDDLVVVTKGAHGAALAPLPVAALRLGAATTALLRRLGLARIGDLYALPREALARRFRGAEGLDDVPLRLDQASGLRPEPVAALAPLPDYRERLAPLDPILDHDGLAAGLRLLLGRLAARLARDGRGARLVVLEAVRADGTRFPLRVRTSRPARDPDHLMRLMAERLPAVDPGFGIDLLILDAPETVRVEPAQGDLAGGRGGEAYAGEALTRLVDRLTVRLGEGAVWRPAPGASRLPERAEARRPAGRAGAAVWPEPGDGPGRPLRLLRRPEPCLVMAEVPDGPPARFTWRRVTRRVALARGPERLAAEWWRVAGGSALPARDYYEVEDERGRRYWLFRLGPYAGGGAPPAAWFVHGLFA